MNQKGSVLLPVLLLALLVFLIIAGFYYFKNISKPITEVVTVPSLTTAAENKYQDNYLSFSYPDGFEVVEESEEDYFKRTNTNYRKNFTYYVTYSPPLFVKSIIVKEKNKPLGSQFSDEPLTIWIFENEQDLSVDKWYANYWYYPFVWGQFNSADKDKIAPEKIATISGITGKFNTVSYQPAKPKFMLISKNNKMFLLRATGSEKEDSSVFSGWKLSLN